MSAPGSDETLSLVSAPSDGQNSPEILHQQAGMAPSEARQQERDEAALFLDQARAIPGQTGVLLRAVGRAWVNSAERLTVNNAEAIRWNPTVVAAVELLAELRGAP